MQRYFVPAEQFTESAVVLSGDDAHHAVRVMRMQPGDRFICSNGEGREALVVVTEIDKATLTAKIVEELPLTAEPQVQVWIAQSLPKGDKMESVIQKCTEIGAARFIPFISERTIVHYDGKKEARRLERWRKIAKEAAEQAHRNRVPQIDEPLSWPMLLKQVEHVDLACFAYEKENVQQLREHLIRLEHLHRQQPIPENNRMVVLLIIGPEGGFTEREVADAEAAGCKSISLGRRILRTETAAMVGLTCILYEFGEMGDKPCQL